MILRKFFYLIISLAIVVSCSSLQTKSLTSKEDKISWALAILGNPPGTFPINNSDIPQLIEYSRHSDPILRHMAIYQLSQLNTDSFYDDIVHLLIDEDISVAKNVEELLLKNKRQSTDTLVKTLKSNSKEIILRALDLLSIIRDKNSLPQIIELFASEDSPIVEKAILTASKIADVNDKILFNSLLRDEAEIRVGIVKTFSNLRDSSAMGTLLPYFYDRDTRVQKAVKFAFVEFGEDSIPYLMNLMKNPAPLIQLSVLGLFEALQNESSIPLIISFFDDPNSRVKASAIHTVSTFKEKALIFLAESAQSDNVEIKRNSLELLGKVKRTGSLEILISLIDQIEDEWFQTIYDIILSFEQLAADLLIKKLDQKELALHEIAIKGLLDLADLRLIVDEEVELYTLNNRGLALILNSVNEELLHYLEKIKLSGLIERDFYLLNEIEKATIHLKNSENNILNSESKYAELYLLKNEYIKKSEVALQLSFSFMHDYMNHKNKEDLESAKLQKELSNTYKEKVLNLNGELVAFKRRFPIDASVVEIFEQSKKEIISSYNSISLNRKSIADGILIRYNLSFREINSKN